MFGVVRILLFYLWGLLVYFLLRHRRKKRPELWDLLRGKLGVGSRRGVRTALLVILLLAGLMGCYSLICGHVPPISDRGNYASKFSNHNISYYYKNSKGLYAIVNLLYLISDDARVLMFTVPFLCAFLLIVAYDCFEEKTPFAILLAVTSLYCVYPLYLFKQAPAIALGAIAFALLLKGKKLAGFLFAALAILFHESALVLLPLFLCFRLVKRRWVRCLIYCAMIVGMVGFDFIVRALISMLGSGSSLYDQLSSYITESGSIGGESTRVTVLKGFPYYFITVFGFVMRKRCVRQIRHYDWFLMLSLFASATTVLSGVMYWMWRFGSYVYFPVMVFYGNLISKIRKKANRLVLGGTVLFLFFALSLRYLVQIYYIRGGF